MVGNQELWQDDLFVACTLRDLIPADHILRRVNKVLELSWLRGEVKGLYDEYQGRPSIDPESAVRLMLAGFFQGIAQDRKLMREAQVNIAIRWFAGYRLHEKLPDHSSLTRIRQRWGEERFRRIFQKTVEQCIRAGLVDGETVHVDATLIRADVSWESLVERHAEQVMAENPARPEDPAPGPEAKKRGRPRTTEKAPKKISLTDPDATLTTSCQQLSDGAFVQATHGGGRQGWSGRGRGGDDRRAKRRRATARSGRSDRGEHRPEDRDRDGGRRVCAWRELCGARRAADRRGDSAAEGNDRGRSNAAASLPIRREEPSGALSGRKAPATERARRARNLVSGATERLRGLPLARAMLWREAEAAPGADCEGIRSAPASAAPTRALERGRPAALPAASLARRRNSRREQDPAWTEARGATASLEHRHPGVPDRSGDQPEAPRGASVAHFSLGVGAEKAL